MPRLSLYKPERGQDYKFIDRQVSEMFQVGGTDVYLHKYVGTKNPTTGTADQPIYAEQNVTNIQDLLFLENRDRKYDPSIYRIRGLYNVANIDFNLSQFGLFIDNDTLFMTVHINDFIKYIGRKPISGDVLELPHLVDQFALNDADVSLPRYYVIEDVGRASEGFSATWFPHLYRLKLKKITDSQAFADILKTPAGADMDKFVGDYDPTVTYHAGDIVRNNGVLYTVTADVTGMSPPNTTYFTEYNNSIENLLSTRAKELLINDSVLQQAEADAPMSGYETRQFYTLAVDEQGKTTLQTADETELDASNNSYNASTTANRPVRTGYTGYLVGDGIPVNGYEPRLGALSDFGHGIQFPEAPGKDDFFLRTDFMPNRLFRFDGTRWVKVEDAVRMNMTNNDTRQTLKTSFINNTNYIYNDIIEYTTIDNKPKSAVDYIKLPPSVMPPATVPENYNYVLPTEIEFNELTSTAKYVVFKLNTLELSFSTTDFSGLISEDNGKIKITLPLIDSTQQVLPELGMWRITLCNHREEIRQSLSKALRPKADL